MQPRDNHKQLPGGPFRSIPLSNKQCTANFSSAPPYSAAYISSARPFKSGGLSLPKTGPAEANSPKPIYEQKIQTPFAQQGKANASMAEQKPAYSPSSHVPYPVPFAERQNASQQFKRQGEPPVPFQYKRQRSGEVSDAPQVSSSVTKANSSPVPKKEQSAPLFPPTPGGSFSTSTTSGYINQEVKRNRLATEDGDEEDYFVDPNELIDQGVLDAVEQTEIQHQHRQGQQLQEQQQEWNSEHNAAVSSEGTIYEDEGEEEVSDVVAKKKEDYEEISRGVLKAEEEVTAPKSENTVKKLSQKVDALLQIQQAMLVLFEEVAEDIKMLCP